MSTEAIVVVPGIMGSVLMKGDQVIWPGSPSELVFPYKHLSDLLDPALIATDIIRSFSISEQYGDLIRTLESCGFREGGAVKTLRVFPYDWRKDNGLAAAGLADCVDDLVASLGDEAIVNIVAHSMGGLVSRSYLESGHYATRPGFSRVRRLITLATPHRGAPTALFAALGQERRLFLNEDQVKVVASDPRFPALYQLLPPPGEPFAWDRADDARYAPLDIYDSNISGQLGLVRSNLDSAAAFYRTLNLANRPQQVRYFFFAGTQKSTASLAQIRLSGSGGQANAMKIERDDAGDGTVPTWSAIQSGVQTESVGGEHGEIYKNHLLKKVLCTLLGRGEAALVAGPFPELSIKYKVLPPETENQIVIDFPQYTVTVRGELQIRQSVDSSGNALAGPRIITKSTVAYSGPPVDHLAVLMASPQLPGIYGLDYYDEAAKRVVASTEFFVQG